MVVLILAIPAAVILTLGLSLGLGTEPHQISNTETYALSDNRIISYKGDFCQDLRTSSTAQTKNPNQQPTGYLYFLRSRPPLTIPEVFNDSVTADLNTNFNFQYWNFYLNTGSEAHFKVCYKQLSGSPRNIILHIIRGIDQLNKWTEEPRDSDAEETYRLTSDCDTIDYDVPEDGMYYFVFYLSSGSFGTVDVDFVIDRLLYDVQPDNIVHECSFDLDGRSSCSLSGGWYTPYTAVLSLNASRPIDYARDGAEIRISCQPRGWLYAVIVLAVLIVFSLMFVCGIAVVVKIVLVAIKKKPSSTTGSKTTSVVVPGSTIESSFTKPAYPTQTAPLEYPPPPPYS